LGKALLAFFVHGKEKSFIIHTKFFIAKKSFLNPLSLEAPEKYFSGCNWQGFLA
jgi:hypothetical protein